MLDQVKVMMDESSKQSLDVLRRHFAELFEPLRQISDFTQDLADIKDSLNNLSDDVHKKINDLTDALDPDQIRKNLRHLVQAQEDINQKLTQISENINDFKSALIQIDWNSPVKDSK